MTVFSPENLRKRFAELTDKAAGIRKVSDPLRAKRDAHVQKAREGEDKMNADIKAAEKGLFEIEQERGMIVRALDGKTSAGVGLAED